MPTTSDPTSAPPPYSVLLFDGECLLCDRSVRFVLERDRRAHFHFAPLQSMYGQTLLERCGLPLHEVKSMVLVDPSGEFATKSTAALRVAARLGMPWSLLSVFRAVPRFVRDAIYDIIARNRYRWFGRRDACVIPAGDWAERFHE